MGTKQKNTKLNPQIDVNDEWLIIKKKNLTHQFIQFVLFDFVDLIQEQNGHLIWPLIHSWRKRREKMMTLQTIKKVKKVDRKRPFPFRSAIFFLFFLSWWVAFFLHFATHTQSLPLTLTHQTWKHTYTHIHWLKWQWPSNQNNNKQIIILPY